jgi:hypothetical protein
LKYQLLPKPWAEYLQLIGSWLTSSSKKNRGTFILGNKLAQL